ncbi:MAG: NAD(P)/FAD-dependent oxidoreductase, partial [Candidatus Aminicenantales bacterium]
MRVIVVGNGLAGTIFSKSLRELHREADIDIFTDESWLYYPRPNLIEFLAGSTTQEHLFAFPPEWYRDQNINVRVGTKVVRIDPGSQRVELERGNQERYDVLMLATGARAFLPPFTGAQKKGVFTLRTLEDAQNILAWIADRPRTVVIGGGLLGLEIARALRTRGAKVRVVEFFDRLLPRQLDSQGASLLKNQIENLGIEVRVGVAIEEIMGEKEITGLRFKSGEEWSTDAAIVAAGIRPNIDLAAQAGLETEKGIVVND